MKKTIKIISITLVIAMLTLVLASCGPKILLGTYTSEGSLGSIAGAKTSYTFSGVKNVTLTSTTTLLGSTSTSEYKGTYELKTAADGTQQITLTFEDSDASSYSGTYTFEQGKTEDGVETIKIGMSTYTKKK